MRKFTVRLSALPGGTVDFFDLLRRIFNTESITRLVRLRQMLSVSAMLANPQKSSKVPAGSADRRTCKVHSEIESLAPEIFSFLRHVYFCYTFILVVFSFLQYIPLRHCLYLYDNNPSKIKNTAADGVPLLFSIPLTPSALPPGYPPLQSYKEDEYIFHLKAQILQEVVFLFLWNRQAPTFPVPVL